MSLLPRCTISPADNSNAASYALPLTGWANAGAGVSGTAPAAGDLVVVFGADLNATGAVTESTGTWTFQYTETDNTGTPTYESWAAWRIFDGTETSPTFTWPTAKRFCLIAVAFAPDAGSTIAVDAWATAFMDTTSATTHTPNAATAAGSGETSYLMAAVSQTATGTTPESFTAPAGWTVLATGNSAGTSTQRVLAASCAYKAGVSGSVAPGAWTLSGAATGNFYHVLVKETSGGGSTPVSSSDSASAAETGVISQDGSVKTAWRKLVQPAGGGTMNVIDISPDGRLAAGCDTQGALISYDQGDHWYGRNAGLGAGGPCGSGTSAPEIASPTYWFQFAAIAWSSTEPNTVYGCVGDGGAYGGFVASTNGMATWSMRSTVPQFAGNQATGTTGADPRSTGRLIAQDGTYLWVGTDNQGVLRTAAGPGQQAGADGFGVTCTMAGSAPGSTYWCRSLVYDSARNYLWAAFYNSGLWVCTNPQAATPNFTKVTGTPTGVEEIAVLGGYVYCAASTSGLQQYSITGASWTSLNGSTISASSTWEGIDAIAVSGSHVVALTCSSPVSGASFVKATVASAGAGSVTYHSMAAADLDNNDLPPDNQSLFLETATLVLGGSASKNNYVRFDPTDSTGNRIYVSGSNGFYRSADGGLTWKNARNGWGGFHVWAVACNPVHDGHLVFGSTDYGAFDVTDGLGWTSGAITNDSPGGMARVLVFDPADQAVFAGYCTKGTVSSGGGAAYRPWNSPNSWTDLALGTHVSGYAPTGMSVFRDASGYRICVAAVQAHGIWRWTSQTSSWTQVSSAAMTATQVAYTGMDYAGNGVVFCYDRAQGIYRSTDYGQTWSLIWSTAVATADFTSGYISVNPAVSGELWVSTDTALYKLSGANSGTPVTTQVTASAIGTGGPVKCGKDGAVYCATRDTGSGMGIFKTLDGGTTWVSLDPDKSFAVSSSYPFQLDISSSGRLYAGGNNLLTLPSGAATGSADSGHAAEGASVSTGGTPESSADTGHGADSGSVRAALAKGDTGHAAETVSVRASSADSGHGAEGSSVHAALAKADTGHAAEAGTARSNTNPSSADAAHAAESAFYYHSATAEAPHGAEGAVVGIAGADAAAAADTPRKSWPGSSDAARAADAPLRSWPSSADAGHGAEAVRPFPVSRSDYGHGTDADYDIGIWAYTPIAVRFGGKRKLAEERRAANKAAAARLPAQRRAAARLAAFLKRADSPPPEG